MQCLAVPVQPVRVVLEESRLLTLRRAFRFCQLRLPLLTLVFVAKQTLSCTHAHLFVGWGPEHVSAVPEL